jgi:flagellar basal body-associated protein FliL
MSEEMKSAPSGENEDLNQTQNMAPAPAEQPVVPEKKHSILTPLLIVLLTIMIIGAIGLGVYYYLAGVKEAEKTTTQSTTTPKSAEEQQLDSVQTDLDNTKDLDTTGVDADAAEIESIDVSGAL